MIDAKVVKTTVVSRQGEFFEATGLNRGGLSVWVLKAESQSECVQYIEFRGDPQPQPAGGSISAGDRRNCTNCGNQWDGHTGTYCHHCGEPK
jgi:hypothetical protein